MWKQAGISLLLLSPHETHTPLLNNAWPGLWQTPHTNPSLPGHSTLAASASASSISSIFHFPLVGS